VLGMYVVQTFHDSRELFMLVHGCNDESGRLRSEVVVENEEVEKAQPLEMCGPERDQHSHLSSMFEVLSENYSMLPIKLLEIR
jgi:hypothetical protein